jgi:hypothetical protein
LQHRAERGLLYWYTSGAKNSTIYWLYDDKDRRILAFMKYGHQADLRVMVPSGMWLVTNVRGKEHDMVLIERNLGLREGTLTRLLLDTPNHRLGAPNPGLTWNQWTTAPEYENPKYDYRAFFKKMREEAPPYILSALFRAVKSRRHEAYLARHAFKWENAYATHRVQLEAWFRQQQKDCMDNFRVARVGDRQRLHHYMKQKNNGCCGSVDVIITIEGVNYHVGFNYGH